MYDNCLWCGTELKVDPHFDMLVCDKCLRPAITVSDYVRLKAVDGIPNDRLQKIGTAERGGCIKILPFAPGTICKWEIIDGVFVDAVISGMRSYPNTTFLDLEVIVPATGEILMHTSIPANMAEGRLTRTEAEEEPERGKQDVTS